MSTRQDRVHELLLRNAGEYIARESNRTALITPTRATISPDFKNATILVSVFPAKQERGALDFLSRHERGFREYLKSRKVLRRSIPRVRFEIDRGEKHRQQLDSVILDA